MHGWLTSLFERPCNLASGVVLSGAGFRSRVWGPETMLTVVGIWALRTPIARSQGLSFLRKIARSQGLSFLRKVARSQGLSLYARLHGLRCRVVSLESLL